MTTRTGIHPCGLLDNERGAALAIVLVMLMVLAAMAASTVMLSTSDLMISGNQRQSNNALSVAEAGISESMHRMSMQVGTMANVGGTDIDASIFDPADPPDINWSTRIYLTTPGQEPATVGSDISTVSLQGLDSPLTYSHPTDPSRAILIEHKTRDFDGDGNAEVVYYDPSLIPPENPSSGFPVEQVSVEGHHGKSMRRIVASCIRYPISPSIQAAIHANGTVDLRGNVTVCGHNHRWETPVGTPLPTCSPAWDEADGHLFAVMTSGFEVDVKGSTDLLGSPSPIDSDANNEFFNIADALGVTQTDLQNLLDSADHVGLDGGPYSGITYVPESVKVSDLDGEGLLYVDGDLHVSGKMNWKGLVYVEGTLKNTGQSWILGAVIADGVEEIAVDAGTGSAAILYSRDALVRTLTGAMRYIVLSWKEM